MLSRQSQTNDKSNTYPNILLTHFVSNRGVQLPPLYWMSVWEGQGRTTGNCSTVYNRVTVLSWEIADSDVSGSAGEQDILVKTTTGRPSLFCRALSLIPTTTCTSGRRRQRSDILLSSPPFVCGNRDGEHRARQGSHRFQYLYIFFFIAIHMDKYIWTIWENYASMWPSS